MYTKARRILSQNFFYSRKFVNKLVRLSSLGEKDTVLDIGAGKGIVTEVLIPISKKVIAIEIDQGLYCDLKNKFKANNRVQIVNKDFLTYKLPNYPYKVFANIPFNIEGKIIRKLLNDANPPEDCYLVVRKDLAKRLIGTYKECQFSISYKPWFEFTIVHYFRRTDFELMARMDTVLLRFTKRKNPLVSKDKQREYYSFVENGFRNGATIKQSLRNYFSYHQLKKLARTCHFSLKNPPSELKLEQWAQMFNSLSLTKRSFG